MPSIRKQTVRGADGRMEDVWALPNDEAFLLKLFTELFDDHHDKISWGPLLTGAAYELKSPRKPKSISHSDGYLTVHWGDKGHFHLCIGDIRVPGDGRTRKNSSLNGVQAASNFSAVSIATDIRTLGVCACSTARTNRKSRCSSPIPTSRITTK